MRLLVVNPNTTQAVTDRIAAVARSAASAGTEIHAVTAARGASYISTRAEAVLGAASVLEMLATHAHEADAVVIAAFADPGLGAARELLSSPVVGMAEAAMLTACMLGRRFAVLSFAVGLEGWYQECIDATGLGARCAGIFCLDEPFNDIATLAEEKAQRLAALCERAIAGGADVCILGGAPMAGVAALIQNDVRVPMVDGIAAAIRQAETLVALAPRKATAGTFRKPGPKAFTGISPDLRRLFDPG